LLCPAAAKYFTNSAKLNRCRQTAMLTDMLFHISLLRHVSKHLVIFFEIGKKD